MLVFQNREQELLVTTDDTRILAHDVATGARQWDVYFPFPVNLNVECITRITDEGEFLFYDQYSMGTYRFTASGDYSSFTSMGGSKELKGVRIIRWNEEAKSLLTVVQGAKDWYIAVLTH